MKKKRRGKKRRKGKSNTRERGRRRNKRNKMGGIVEGVTKSAYNDK